MDRIKPYLPVILVAVSAAALVPMVSGISKLSLKPGTLFDPTTLNELRALYYASGVVWNSLFSIIFIISILLLALYFFRSKKSRLQQDRRKRPLLTTLIQILLWLVAIILLRRRIKLNNLDFKFAQNAARSLADFDFNRTEDAVESLPGWIAFLFSFIFIGALFIFIWWRRRPNKSLLEMNELISKKANETIEELNTGVEFREVITKCYFEMNQILQNQRGIKRITGMTPREFQHRLIDLDFPAEAVTQLTRLFEMVRYGTLEPDEDQQDEAVACLKAIKLAGE
jgi:preprotein translocase subunit YajC